MQVQVYIRDRMIIFRPQMQIWEAPGGRVSRPRAPQTIVPRSIRFSPTTNDCDLRRRCYYVPQAVKRARLFRAGSWTREHHPAESPESLSRPPTSFASVSSRACRVRQCAQHTSYARAVLFVSHAGRTTKRDS